MASDFIPRGTNEATSYYTTLLKALANDPAGYGVDAAAVTALQTRLTALKQSVQAVVQLQAGLASEVQHKTQLRAGIEADVRALVRQIQANPNIDSSHKARAGIPTHHPATTHTAPQTPTELSVTPYTNGVNVLSWQRADNPRGTHFVIEARTAAETEFSFLNVVTATRYEDREHPVGTRVVYRVRARRARQLSGSSNVGVVC